MISRAEAEQWAEDYLPGGKWVKPGEEYLVNNPLREDRNPSLAVSFAKKCYIDRGAGESGKLSDLCARLNIPEPGREERKNTAAVPDFNAIIRNGEAKKTADKSAEARLLWDRAVPAGADHPYIERKGINADGLRQTADGVLLVPAYSTETGELIGLERIDMSEQPGRQKRHLGQKAGTYFPRGSLEADTPLLLCEGMATSASVHALSDWTAVSVFGAPQLAGAARLFKSKYPGRDIVVCPDFDQAGRRAAAEARKAGFKVVELPAGSRDKFDWNDLHAELGLEQARELFLDCWQAALAAETMDADVDTSRGRSFRFLDLEELDYTPPQWIVRGVLEKDSLASLFGASESGKSFIAVDLGLSVAAGAHFAGHMVQSEGLVCYVAGEGAGGIKKRVAAWLKDKGLSRQGVPFALSTRPADMLDADSVGEVIREAEAAAERHGVQPVLFIFDTLSRNFGAGDENSSQDMKQFVDALDAIRLYFPQSTIVTVHHSGHQEKGRARGSSVFRAAMDVEYLVEGDGSGISMKNTKMKDAARRADIHFVLEDVLLGEDEYGEPFGSAVLRRTDEPAARERKLSPNTKLALDTYHEAAQENPVLDDEGRFVGVHVKAWEPVFNSRSTAGTRQGKWAAFNNGRKALVEQRLLTVKNDVYSPVEPADRILTGEYAKRLNQVVGRQQPSTSVNKLTSVDAQSVRFCQQPSTTPYRVLTVLTPTVDGQEEKELSDNAAKGEKAPGTLPEERAVEIPSPRGQKILGAKDVRLPDALRWARNQPGLMKRLALEARQMGDGGMVDAGDYLNTAVKCEYADWLNSEAGADQGDSPEAAPSEGAASTDQEAEVVPSLAVPEPASVSLEAIAARAGVDIEVVREGVLPWVQVGRLAVSGDSVRIVEGATGYPGDDEPDAPDDEPPDDSSDIREGEEPDSKGGEVMPDDKVPVPDYGDGGPAPGQSEASYRLLGRWSEEEQEADIARLATMSRERGDEEGR